MEPPEVHNCLCEWPNTTNMQHHATPTTATLPFYRQQPVLAWVRRSWTRRGRLPAPQITILQVTSTRLYSSSHSSNYLGCTGHGAAREGRTHRLHAAAALPQQPAHRGHQLVHAAVALQLDQPRHMHTAWLTHPAKGRTTEAAVQQAGGRHQILLQRRHNTAAKNEQYCCMESPLHNDIHEANRSATGRGSNQMLLQKNALLLRRHQNGCVRTPPYE